MKTVKILLIALVALNLGVVAYLCYASRQPKLAYVDNIALFNGFQFKKERQAEYEKQKSLYQGQLDTLRMTHLSIEQALEQNPTNADLQKRRMYSLENYQQTNHYFAQKLDSIDGVFNEEVWGKINAYVTEYGQEKNYDMVIGATGTGTLMYGSKAYDITEDVLAYINEKYEGN